MSLYNADNDNFYNYDNHPVDSSGIEANLQVMQYLEDPFRNLRSLASFPGFMGYNTVNTSSASVERYTVLVNR